MPARTAPSCARCGYDLSGAVAAWTDRCPVRGVCTECGLDQAWRDVFVPEYARVPGLFEHGRGWAPVRCFRTIGALLNPWRLWSRMRMHSAIHPARLFVFTATVILGAHLVNTALTAGLALSAAGWNLLANTWAGDVARERLMNPYRVLADGFWRWNRVHHWAVLGLGVTTPALVPFAYALLPVSLRRARVRAAHRYRVGAYAGAAGVLAGSAVFLAVTLLDHVGLRSELGLGPVPCAWAITLAAVGTAGTHWAVASKRYLCLEHATLAAWSMVLVALLAASVVWTLIATAWIQTRLGAG